MLKRKLEEEITDSDTNNNNDNNKIVEDSTSQDDIVLRTSQTGLKTTGLNDEEETGSPVILTSPKKKARILVTPEAQLIDTPPLELKAKTDMTIL